jgi:hypothetical protein
VDGRRNAASRSVDLKLWDLVFLRPPRGAAAVIPTAKRLAPR